MSLTSFQKNYIKKNFQKLSVNQISSDLSLPEKTIKKFLKKRLSPEKYAKITNQSESHYFDAENHRQNPDFKLRDFLAKNTNTIIFLFLIIFLVYFNSLGNDFVSDDIAGIKNNPRIGDFSLVLSSPMGFFQRLIYFSIFKIGGLNPMLFRIPNIIFHFGSVVLVYLILNILTYRKSLAIIAAILTAVHPILVESVSWISGSLYVEYGFFLLLSFLFYILYEDKRKYWSVLFFIIALIFSEKALIFPGIIFVYELANGKLRQNWKSLIPSSVISFFFLLTYLLLGKIGQRVSDISSVSYQDSSGLYNPLIQVPTAIANYLKLIFWPQKLTLYQTEMNFTNVQFAFILLVFITFLGFIFYGWKKNRLLFFWLCFFVISLSPTLTPFKISWVVAERYAYLGSIGIFISIAMFLNWIFEKAKEKDNNYKMIALSLIILIIIALSARTITRNVDWKNEDNLWIATGKFSSSGPNIHNNLGDVYARHSEFDKAAEEFKKAIQINPNYADAYHNLANTYKSMGKNELAMENYQKALSINPNIWQSHQNLAALYYEMGDFQKAKESMEKAVFFNPQDENLKKNLELVKSQLGK